MRKFAFLQLSFFIILYLSIYLLKYTHIITYYNSPYVSLIILPIVILGVFGILYLERKATTAVWRSFSKKLGTGIILIPGGNMFTYPKIEGIYKTLPYSLYIRCDATDNTKHTIIDIKPASVTNFNLHICQRSRLGIIGHGLGWQNIQTGDKEFDDTFVIKSKTPDRVIQFFDNDLRQKLLAGKDKVNIFIDDNSIRSDLAYILTDISSLNYITDLLCLMADKLSGKETLVEEADKKQSSDIYAEPYRDELSTKNISKTRVCPACDIKVLSDSKLCPNCGRNV